MNEIYKGAAANDKTGTPARQAADIINDNFAYLDAKIGNVDKIIAQTGHLLVGQDLTYYALWKWEITGSLYSNPVDVVTHIPFTSSGKERFDIFALTTSNTFLRIAGPESDPGVVDLPDLPVDMIQAGVVKVTDSTVGEPTLPVLGDIYVEKVESQDFTANYGVTTVIDKIDLPDERASISLVGSATDVKSVQVSGEFIRPGKPHYFKNRTDHNVKLWHNAGAGNVKYFFPNGLDLIVRPNEIIEFNTNANDSAAVRFEYVGNFDKTYFFSNIPAKATALVDADLILAGDSEDGFKTKTRTFAQLIANLRSYFVDLTTVQTISGGLKTFLNGTFGLRNAANTFTLTFTNAITAARTVIWPDKSGTVAMTSDIIAQLNGTVNRLVKFGTSTTGIDSRIIDTGTYVGIGTVVTPTKYITLGGQDNREIGVEQSVSTTPGRDLIMSAGRTINFQLTSDFVNINQISRSYRKGCSASNNDFFIPSGTVLYKQIGGSGDLISYFTSPYNIFSCAIDASNNLFISTSNGLYKQTNSTGTFVLESGITLRAYYSMSFHVNGDLYGVCAFIDVGGTVDYVYRRVGNTGDFIADTATTGRYNDVSCAPNGDVYVTQWAVGILKKNAGTSIWNSVLSNAFMGSICVLTNGYIYATVTYTDKPPYPLFYISSNNGTSFGLSSVNIPPHAFLYIVANKNNVYAASYQGSSIYVQNNDSLGTPDLNGGTLKLKAGTGKNLGQSRVQIITGQKTSSSGTDMQVETVRTEWDETGLMKQNGDLQIIGLTKLGQYTTSTRPAYQVGAEFFDTTINKKVIGGASAWEVVTSV